MTHPLDVLEEYIEREQGRLEDTGEVKHRYAKRVMQDIRNRVGADFISRQQQKLAYSLFGDISNHTGYSKDEVKSMCKQQFCLETSLPYFSLAYGCIERSLATEFIQFIIRFMDENSIPLQHDPRPAVDEGWWIQRSIDTHTCAVCGRGEPQVSVHVHHIDVLGMGRDRNKVGDQGRKVCLCAEHHQELHASGEKSFAEKYHFGDVMIRKAVA